MPGTRYCFGCFELDSAARRLTRDGAAVPVAARHFDVLVQLVSRAGDVVSKDLLIDAAWRDVAVTDNSLEQAISALRRTLGDAPGGSPYVQTVPRQGYRFVGAVSRSRARDSDEALEALLAPHRALVDGRAALETLGRDRVASARAAFERALQGDADHAPAHVGMAMACAFEFEATRVDAVPDVAALGRALEHARTACRLDADYAEAWATLAFVLHRTGDTAAAVAAARRAIALEPDNWRHHLRLGVVSWGEERLRAADRALKLLPGLALAHWLAATVHVARHAFDAAVGELDAGAAAQETQQDGRFAAVGIHLLRGLVWLDSGDETAAREAFARELACEARGHLYARECCANVWYAVGALEWRKGDRDRAAEAFAEAQRRVPGHPLVMAASGEDAGSEGSAGSERRRPPSSDIDAAHATAVHHARAGRPETAAGILTRALHAAPPGSAGWTVGVDPMLHCAARPDVWGPVLALLRSRAA